jgi:hypothetical protein
MDKLHKLESNHRTELIQFVIVPASLPYFPLEASQPLTKSACQPNFLSCFEYINNLLQIPTQPNPEDPLKQAIELIELVVEVQR